MSPYLEKNSGYSGKPWKADFPDDVLTYMRESKKDLYSITLTAYKAAWLYNKNLWTKAGLTEADEPKTWGQFFTVLDKLKASGIIPIARTGDAFALSHAYWIVANSVGRKDWLAMSGGKVFADDKTQVHGPLYRQMEDGYAVESQNRRSDQAALPVLATGQHQSEGGGCRATLPNQKAVLWQGTPGNQGQTILRRIDEAKAEGLQTFDVGAFPTPQPDAETFGADIAANAAPLADDGERGLEYGIPIADLRRIRTPVSRRSAWTASNG